ncbi:ANTAR domain-containing protein [Arthrobacter pigmenti]
MIDIAVGIIMAQSRCSQEAAFGFLRTASSHRNIKIREIAAQVVAGLGTGEPETHFVN